MDMSVLSIMAVVIGLALGIILHEVAHGWAALWLGDPTAKYAGRLSLNPIKHVDLIGTILIPLVLLISQSGFLFGWAKPVPVNYYNLRYGKYGTLLVALAGPATNFIIVAITGIAYRFSSPDTAFPILFGTIASINALLMFFNLIPLPPLDGSKILYLFLDRRPDIINFLERYSFYILLAILIFGGGLLGQLVYGPAETITRFFTGI